MKLALISTRGEAEINACLPLADELQADGVLLLAQGQTPAGRRALLRMQAGRATADKPTMTLIFREFDTLMQAFEIVGSYLAADNFLLSATAGEASAEALRKAYDTFNASDADAVVVVIDEEEEVERYAFCMKPIVIASLQALKQKNGIFGEERRTVATVSDFIAKMKEDGLKVRTVPG